MTAADGIHARHRAFGPRFAAAAVMLLSFSVVAFGTAQAARLESGEPIVKVSPSSPPADGEVSAVIDIAAPASAIYSALTECAKAPQVFPSLKSCRVLETDPKLSWDVREHKVASWASFLPDLSTVFRSEYERDRRISFRLVSGDLEHLVGEWRLEPLKGGKLTRVTYRAEVGFHPLIPAFLVRQSLQADVPRFLASIRDESLRRAR